jgi:pimeloyl-ACP methyl ester carboxylesterase
LKAVSIFGTNDGLSSPEEIETARELLPPDTNYVAIEGGNHAQFGWYGPQRGDLPAEISHQEQQTQAVAATVQLLATLNE